LAKKRKRLIHEFERTNNMDYFKKKNIKKFEENQLRWFAESIRSVLEKKKAG